ncbi:MAG: DUF1616 domain-containing protein [Anaerolineae bacterium]|nr:DUF1616 domain-containing protein [Anaerolineae bacterium]
MRNNRYWDLLLVAGWAIASLFLVQLALPAWTKMVLVVPWVLGLTGYAIVAAIFPGKALGKAERLLFVIVLSCATSALGGAILNLTSAGLRRDNWLLYLCVVTGVACGVALLRRLFGGQAMPVASNAHAASHWRVSHSQWVQGGLFACAGLIAIAAIALARIPPAPAEGLQGYTLLWVLPPGIGKNTDAQAPVWACKASSFRPRNTAFRCNKQAKLLKSGGYSCSPANSGRARLLPYLMKQMHKLLRCCIAPTCPPLFTGKYLIGLTSL